MGKRKHQEEEKISFEELKLENETLKKKLKYYENLVHPLKQLSEQFDSLSLVTNFLDVKNSLMIKNLSKKFQQHIYIDWKQKSLDRFENLEELISENEEEKFVNLIDKITHWDKIYQIFHKERESEICFVCLHEEFVRNESKTCGNCCMNYDCLEMTCECGEILLIKDSISCDSCNENHCEECVVRYSCESCGKERNYDEEICKSERWKFCRSCRKTSCDSCWKHVRYSNVYVCPLCDYETRQYW